jgi:eukaryotic-like serine/threonine-protein kinase
MALVPGTRLGPYEVVAPLGAGGMGEVYRARDTRLDRTVAIKLLPPRVAHDPERRARFEREARTISSLNHPHICTLFDVGEAEGSHFLVMELLEGESLADRLQLGPLPLDQVVKYGAQVADALDCAHKQGIVHRDLKPGNVVLTRSGAKLLDFGLARSTAEASLLPGPEDQATEAKPLTAAGTVLGTYQYMAPEQLAGAEAGPRTDIFALGTLLYEMATGRRAFEGKSKTSLVAAILSAQPAPISSLQAEVPPALEHVVRKCLEKEPDDRWQSAHDVASELRWIAEAGSQAGMPATVTVRRRTRERLAWALTGAGVILALVGVAWALVLSRGTRTAADPAVIRFLVFPPPGTTIAPGPAAPQVAVSPDGRLLTFSASAEDGTRRLWVRPLEALEARPLPGSEGAEFPFWSPDGRLIGFFAEGKLKAIAATGGPPEVLCAAPYPQGGAWSPSGTILFAGQRNGVIWRVPATGGEPAPATTLDSTRQEVAHWWPQFLPDGHRSLYLVRARQEGHQGLHASSLDSRETVRVLNTTVRAAYAPPGHLLFLREGTLLAQSFDAEKLKLTGEAVPIADGVAYNPANGRTTFSVPASGVLTYREGGVGGTTPTELVWFDRAGKRLGSVGDKLLHIELAISPDGRRLAVATPPCGRPTAAASCSHRSGTDATTSTNGQPVAQERTSRWSGRATTRSPRTGRGTAGSSSTRAAPAEEGHW